MSNKVTWVKRMIPALDNFKFMVITLFKMKLSMISCMLCSFFLHSIYGKAQGSFDLSIHLKNTNSPSRVMLTIRDNGEWKEVAAESSNGSFHLTGTVTDPSFAFLVMKHLKDVDLPPQPENVLHLFVENKTIVLKGETELARATITGSASQLELDELEREIKNSKSAQKNEREEIVRKFITGHPHSFVSLYALQDFSMDGSFMMDAEKVAPLFDLLSEKLRTSASGKIVQHDIQVAQHTRLNSMAPEFIQRDTLGNEVNLQSFLGKYVLIDFWASWCRPCRIENPELVKVQQEFKSKNFAIISVSLDKSRANWVKAIKKDQLEWTHTSDLKFWRNEVALLYGIKSIPQNFVLDPSGKIIGKNIPPKELSNWLKQYLH